jgi:hypothetical protein
LRFLLFKISLEDAESVRERLNGEIGKIYDALDQSSKAKDQRNTSFAIPIRLSSGIREEGSKYFTSILGMVTLFPKDKIIFLPHQIDFLALEKNKQKTRADFFLIFSRKF